MPPNADYDPSVLADLKPTVARLLIPEYDTQGTGFLVAPDQVLTCHHVVERLSAGDQVRCSFGEAAEERTATLVRCDPVGDVALLRLAEPLTGVKPLQLAPDAQRFTSWLGYGFPAFSDGVGVPLVGGVVDPDKRDRDGRAAVQLAADMLTGEDVSLGGFSGTPILYGRSVVGMLYRVLGARGDWSATHFGLLYAVPVRALRALLDGKAAPPSSSAPRDDESRHPDLARLVRELRSGTSPSEVLRTVDELRNKQLLGVPLLLQAAETLLDMGAAGAVLSLLDGMADDERASQLRALAHSLRGEHVQAGSILKALRPSAETGGITGGVSKRRFLETKNPNHLRAAYLYYSTAYADTGNSYPGINAAALALWLGDPTKSRALAAEVLKTVSAKPERERTHWDWATLGEAHLLLGDVDSAITAYQRAVAHNPGGSRAIAAMRTDARVNLERLGRKQDELDDVLFVGSVACVTGHRVDSDNRTPARFPESNVPGVTRALKSIVEGRRVRFGFGSAASGADLLFAETVLDAGGDVTIFLPFPSADFVGTSVGQSWRQRFDDVLRRLAPGRLVTLSEKTPATDSGKNEAYARCNEVVQREAVDAARMLGERPLLVAVVVPAGAAVPRGGTEDAIRLWRERDRGDLVEVDSLAPQP